MQRLRHDHEPSDRRMSASWRSTTRASPATLGSNPGDLLLAPFEETQGVPVSILRQHGVDPDELLSRLDTWLRDVELRNER